MSEKGPSENYKLHTTYAICILIAIIIGLISVKWSEVPRLYDYINFALTMSSLILAILAIVYALHSSGTLFKTLDKIEDSARDISEVSKSIKKSNSDLKDEVSKIPASLEKVDEKVDTSHSLIMSLRGTNTTGSEEQKIETTISYDLLTTYLENSSLVGYQAIVVALAIHKLKIETSFSEVCREIDDDDDDDAYPYMFSYIVSSSAIGITSYRSINRRLSIPDVHPQLEKAIQETHEKKYNSFVDIHLPSEYSEDGDRKDLMESLMDTHSRIPEIVKHHKNST